MVIIERTNYKGNPNIGVFVFATDKFVLIPSDSDEKFSKLVSKTLQVPVIRVSIADTSLLGIFIAGNNRGVLVPHIVKDWEFRILKNSIDVNVEVVKTRFTALGNVCLVNDKAALIHPEAYEELKKVVVDVLAVETVEKGIIAGFPTVGSIAFVNNIAGLVHPDANENELEYLSNTFQVPFDIGTVNFGVGFIKSGLVGNTKGILVGDRTTGPEILRISKVFRVVTS
ncbi:translation initiation factor IF-6 [Ignisphaera sp. 4213-co]|uniref:Translation initiation factor 6 n=1 Tax=Ignisphaera cupida TaxID=3050454 RepID=A0ABD4Z8B0_9CREN|nr:translation initiation factor IF-6 [Ignisphaera sp. 4213-co]MDK6028525.1 translation initiation factor IF-6 [Ignisphaera sp. 4213-co]